jgi:N-methylhydantoinase A/oxoprolinase/acetone carboxylase beta subunit
MAFRFAIDRGGTFCDVFAELPPRGPGQPTRYTVLKLLSVDPENYSDAPTEGIRRILETETGIAHPKGQPVDTSRIEVRFFERGAAWLGANYERTRSHGVGRPLSLANAR